MILDGDVEKFNFNRKERKVVAKNAKVNYSYSSLCELCVESLRTLRLMDFNISSSQFKDFINLLSGTDRNLKPGIQ